MRKDSMGKQDDDFDQLIASLGEVLALTDDSRSLGGGLMIPYAIDVAAIRNKTGLSQAAFARRIGVPVGTIRNWEQGRTPPDPAARTLLALISADPAHALKLLGWPSSRPVGGQGRARRFA